MHSHELFDKNISFISSVSPLLYEQVNKISASILVSFDGDVGSLQIDDEIWLADINSNLEQSLSSQKQSPDRVMFARVVNSEQEKTDIELVSEIVDTENLVVLPQLPCLHSSVSDKCLSGGRQLTRDIVLLGGLSLLYLDKILATDLVNSVLLVEADLVQFKAVLGLLDFQELIKLLREKNIGFHFIFEDSHEKLCNQVFAYYTESNPMALHGLLIYRSPRLSHDLISLHSWLHSRDGLLEYAKGFLGNDTDEFNQLLHALWNSLTYSDAKLITANETTLDESVILVASGPSADKAIDFLKTSQESHTIIAAGSAVGTLLRSGIKVDGLVLLEMGSVVFRDICDLKQEGYFLDDIVLFGSATIDPRIPQFFKHTVFFHRPLSAAISLFPHEAEACLPQAGPQVANAALEVCLQLGIRKFLLIGCDFGASSLSHPRSSLAVGTSERNLDQPVRGRLGATVFTSPELSVTSQMFDNMISHYGARAASIGDGIYLSSVQAYDEASVPEVLRSYQTTQPFLLDLLHSLPHRVSNPCGLVDLLDDAISAINTMPDKAMENVNSCDLWNHAVSCRMSDYISWDDASLAPHELLIKRLTRFLLFFALQPLHDAQTSDSYVCLVHYVHRSLLQISKVTATLLYACRDFSLSKAMPPWDHDWVRQKLADNARKGIDISR